MESFLQEMKQLLQQYFLLLNGKRAMTGKLKALDAQFDLGDNVKLEIGKLTHGSAQYPEWSPTSSIGTPYAFIKGGLYVYDPTLDSVSIALLDKNLSSWSYILHDADTSNQLLISSETLDITLEGAGKITLNPPTETIIKKCSEIEGVADGIFQVAQSLSLPTPSLAYRGCLYVKQGITPPPTPTVDELYFCRKKAEFPPAYEWIQLA